MTLPEGIVKLQISNELKKRKLWYRRFVPSGYDLPFLDYLVGYRGRMIVIEVKAPGKAPTPKQLKTIRQITEEAGAFCFWTDDIDHAKKKLDAIIEAIDLDVWRAEHAN